MTKNYRPDIDGLRALAVLSVVFYHAFPELLVGGYLGVDVFFVISGYLISKILLTDLNNNTFSYVTFYSRRIKRIYPALLLVVSCCFIVGWLCLYADEFIQLGKHTFAGMAFISNIVLLTELNYFDVTSELKPLLHLWSLGVEEQFYIVWPILLSVIYSYQKHALKIIFFIILASISLHFYYSTAYSSAAFYLPITRFWELAIGGLLAYLLHYNIVQQGQQKWLSFLGIAMIIISFILVGHTSRYITLFTLLPTIGTALVILASTNNFVNKALLSNSIVRWAGAISYPLYLWHWPLMVFPRIINGGEISLMSKLFFIALSVLLAYFTYVFLEKKIKNTPKTIIILLILSFTILTLGFLSWKKVISPRNTSSEITVVSEAMNDWTFPDSLKAFTYQEYSFYRLDSKNSKQVLFIGDSLIQQYSPLFNQTQKHQHSKTIIMAAQGGCLPIPNNSSCSNYINVISQFVSENKVSDIIIGACWDCYFIYEQNKRFSSSKQKADALDDLKAFLTTLSEYKSVHLLLSPPSGKYLEPKTQLVGSRFGQIGMNKSLQTITLSKPQLALRDQLIQIANEAGVNIIDPIKALCDGNTCPATTPDGIPLYKDNVHMRPFYVKKSVNYFDSIIYNMSN